ncbi:hypothetical protein CL621_02755 [archaeon]|nr:hypothetical protein [archaeon]|tara:strand:- start:1124 stop:1792 length:669 start_codon:yes stop_codon:yes gene_type:complete
MQKIIVDHRERNSGIIRELAKHDIEVIIKQLISADFIIQTKDLEEKIQTLGIERKTVNDFLNSIIDKRILTQLMQLKKSFDIPLLIIEGTENIYQIRNFHPNSIRGMLTTIAVDFQIPIITTMSYRDTTNLLLTIAKRLDKPRRHISLLKKRKPLTLKEQQEFLIETLPGVGPTLSKALLKKFKSVKAVINAKEEHLKKVEKIGPKKAEKIKKITEENYKED